MPRIVRNKKIILIVSFAVLLITSMAFLGNPEKKIENESALVHENLNESAPEGQGEETELAQEQETEELQPKDETAIPEEKPKVEPKKSTNAQKASEPKLVENPPESTSYVPAQPESKTASSSQGDEVLRLCNLERQKNGLPNLIGGNAKLQEAANVRAGEIIKVFSHTRPNSADFSTAIRESGLNPLAWGENIAYGQKTPQEVVTTWMNSSGHRANILNPNFNTLAVGVSGTYWVQLFIKI